MIVDCIDRAAMVRLAHALLRQISQMSQHLAVFVPKRVRQWWSRPMPTLHIASENDILSVRYRCSGVETVVGHIDVVGHFISADYVLLLDSEAATVLVLPHVRAMIRRIKLPVVSGCAFDEIASIEMDRLTPFSSDEVLFALDDIVTSDGGSAFTARLICILRDDATRYAALCAKGGFPIDSVHVRDTDGTERPLRRVPNLPLRTHIARFRMRFSIVAVLLGFLLVIWQGPSILQSRAASHLAARKSILTEQSARSPYDSGDNTIETILADKRSEVDVLGLLLALSSSLPRDVVAESLSVDRQSVRLVVRCDAVARATSALANISMLSRVTLLHKSTDRRGTPSHLTFHARWSRNRV
jgi:hypothetical protein